MASLHSTNFDTTNSCTEFFKKGLVSVNFKTIFLLVCFIQESTTIIKEMMRWLNLLIHMSYISNWPFLTKSTPPNNVLTLK